MEYPAVHDFGDRQFRRLAKSAPQIGRLRVAKGVTFEITADAVTKDGRPDVLLQHAQHRRSLFVGEYVEHGVGVLGRLDGKFDGPRTA